CGMGDPLFRLHAFGSHVGPSAFALRSLDVRYLRNTFGRRKPSPDHARNEPAPAQARRFDSQPGTHTVVFGSIAAELHGKVRRAKRKRLSVLTTAALVRRGISNPRADLLDAPPAPRILYQPLRSHRNNHCQRVLPGYGVSGR